MTTDAEIEIRRTLRLFHQPGEIVEIRCLRVPGRGKPFQASGYFDDFDLAAKIVAEYDGERKPEGIYHTLNVVNPALFARSPNQITDHCELTTADNNIIERRWTLKDADPVRPRGISSTDDELQSAITAAENVREYLRDRGLPEPVHAISGNGCHVLTPMTMPNDDDSRRAVETLLKTLAAKSAEFTSPGAPAVSIDASVFNAARICRLYGTTARKGHDTPDRPHRRSRLTYIPDYLPGGSIRD
ncbi:MAG: hypothetical protein SH850_00825 [Planctomycetaceae bacterium]|nr:hypothetical protein [Planctomycetaceae bacterium]